MASLFICFKRGSFHFKTFISEMLCETFLDGLGISSKVFSFIFLRHHYIEVNAFYLLWLYTGRRKKWQRAVVIDKKWDHVQKSEKGNDYTSIWDFWRGLTCFAKEWIYFLNLFKRHRWREARTIFRLKIVKPSLESP